MARRTKRKSGAGKLLLVLFLLAAFGTGWYLGSRGGEGTPAAESVTDDTAPAVAAEGPDPAVAAEPAVAARPAAARPAPARAAGTPAPAGPAPLPQAQAGAKLAIVLDDCGQNLLRLDEVLALPFPVTLAILPQQPQSGETARRARAAGKPYILHQPMEPLAPEGGGAPNPGPGALTVATAAAAVDGVLAANLASTGEPRGFNNHMGSRATAEQTLMTALMASAKRRGLFFLDSWTSPQSVALSSAQAAGVPAVRNRVFLDNRDDYGYIDDQLQRAATLAVAGQEIVAIGHITRQQTWRVLRDRHAWLRAAGIELVAAADLAR